LKSKTLFHPLNKVQILACRVEIIRRLNHDTVQVFLKTLGSKSLQYLAGQYIDLIHPDFDPCSFSIANAPVNSGLIELHVRSTGNGKLTNFIVNELEEGSLLKIKGPRGSLFFRRNSKKPIILLAGGVGFSTIKSIIECAIATKFNRPIYLYWGVRSEFDFYLNLPHKWENEYDNIHFSPVLSTPNNQWKGRVGYVHMSVLSDFNNLSCYEVYTCGPPVMVRLAYKSFMELGLPKESFFSELF